MCLPNSQALANTHSRWPETTSIICQKRACIQESNKQNFLSCVLGKGIWLANKTNSLLNNLYLYVNASWLIEITNIATIFWPSYIKVFQKDLHWQQLLSAEILAYLCLYLGDHLWLCRTYEFVWLNPFSVIKLSFFRILNLGKALFSFSSVVKMANTVNRDLLS